MHFIACRTTESFTLPSRGCSSCDISTAQRASLSTTSPFQSRKHQQLAALHQVISILRHRPHTPDLLRFLDKLKIVHHSQQEPVALIILKQNSLLFLCLLGSPIVRKQVQSSRICRSAATERSSARCRALEPRASPAQIGHKDIIHNKLNQILSTNLQSIDEDSSRDLLEEVPLENFQGLASFGRAVYEVK